MKVLNEKEFRQFMESYVSYCKEQGRWSQTTQNFYDVLQLIADKVILNLPVDGCINMEANLPYGQTVADMYVAINIDSSASPYTKATIGTKTYTKTVATSDIESALKGDDKSLLMIYSIILDLFTKEANDKFSTKEALLNTLIGKLPTACVTTLAKPVDTETSEAFIEAVRNKVEVFAHRNSANTINAGNAEACDSFTLYVTPSILASCEVNTLAQKIGNVNLKDISVETNLVKEFTGNTTGVYAILVDNRGVLIDTTSKTITESVSGTNTVFTLTSVQDSYISHITSVHAFKAA